MRFIDQISSDLSLPPNACRVAVALSRYVNSRTLMCWPTQETLAELVGLKERCIRYMLDALATAGHLQVVQIVDKRYQDQRRNAYRLILKDQDQLPAKEKDGAAAGTENTGMNVPVEPIRRNLLESNHLPPVAVTPLTARGQREVAEAEISRLKAEKLASRLIDQRATLRAVEGRARFERDAWIGWVNRVAPLVASEAGAEMGLVVAILDREVRAQLAALAATPLELPNE